MTFTAARLIIFLLVAIPCSIYDAIKMRVPLLLVGAGIVSLLGCQLFFYHLEMTWFLKQSIIGCFFSVVILLITRLATGGGLGWGDVIFGAFTSFYIGYPLFCFIALGLSAVCGIIWFLIFRFTKKIKKNGGVIIQHHFAMPYIPFMTTGTLITYWLLWINWLNF